MDYIVEVFVGFSYTYLKNMWYTFKVQVELILKVARVHHS